MAISSAQLWVRITECNLASQTECRLWAAETGRELGPSDCLDVQKVLGFLISTQRLTPYQANNLVSDRPRNLAVGPLRILGPVDDPIFRNWFESRSGQGEIAWLYLLEPTAFHVNKGWAEHPPSLRLGNAHTQVSHRHLIPFEKFIQQPPVTALVSSPLRLRKGSDSLAEKGKLSLEASTQLIQKIASALDQLHRQNLVHGRISKSALAFDAADEPILLREPLFLPTSPLAANRPTIFAPLADGNAKEVDYAAPEFLVQKQRPTPHTDLYALGCLWFELLTGRTPFSHVPPDQRMTAHATQPIDTRLLGSLPREAIACILYLCAKNPSARFSSTSQLLEAIPKVLSLAASVGTVTSSVATSSVATSYETATAPASTEAVKAKQLPDSNQVKTSAASPASPLLAKPIRASVVDSQAPIPSKPTSPTIKPATVAKPATTAETPSASPKTAAPAAAKLTTPVPTNPVPVPSNPVPSNPVPSTPTNQATPIAPTAQAKAASVQATPIQATSIQSTVPIQAATPIQAKTLAGAPPLPPLSDPEQSTPTVSNPEIVPAEKSSEGPASKNPPTDATANRKKKTAPSGKGRKGKKPASKGEAENGIAVRVKKKKKAKRPVWVLPALAGISLLGLIGLVFVLSFSNGVTISKNDDKKNGQGTKNDSSDPSTFVKPIEAVVDPIQEQYVVQSDDGKMLWAPPRATKPYSLDYLAPGAQAFIFVRPDAWFLSESGKSILSILEEPLKECWNDLKSGSGLAPEDVDELAIGVYSESLEEAAKDPLKALPQFVVRVKPKIKKTLGEYRTLWNAQRDQKVGNSILFGGGGERVYFVKGNKHEATDEVSMFSYGPAKWMIDVAENEGAGGPLRRQMELLWQATDAKADFTVLFSPSYLFIEGKKILPYYAPRFQDSLRELLGRDSQAGMFTTTLEPRWYGELRLMATSEQDSTRIHQILVSQLGALAETARMNLVAQPAHPYWRAIANQLPLMLKALAKHQRFAIESGQSVTNFYLPPEAAPNLTLAAWMSMRNFEGDTVAAVVEKPPVAPVKPLTIDEVLDRPVDVVFDQQSLETAMNSIVDEINNGLPAGIDPVRMEINGTAFELDGVTRNKEVRNFAFRKQPARLVLIDLVKKANPEVIPELTNPAQKVVWVVIDDPKRPGKKLIQLTTRKAAESAKLPLPNEFKL